MAKPFKPKARLFLNGRKEVWESLADFKKQNTNDIIWFHAASLGEFEQGLPVMEAFQKEFPDKAIVVSFYSPSGYEHRKDHPIANFTCYLPIDTHKNASRFINQLNPVAAIFIKYEFWHHYLSKLKLNQVPIFCISAIFTPNHIFFKSYGEFHREMLKKFDHFFVQNSKSLMLLESIGISNVTVAGDTRYDRVEQTLLNPKQYDDISTFTKDHFTLIIGSAWPEDMEVLRRFINEKAGEIKVIIAPHLIDDSHVKKITALIDRPFHLYTDGNIDPSIDILVVNTIGMLSSIYQYGDMAYIGGAFGDGLHNILEAVAFGLPVIFGDKGLDKFPESEELITLGGAFSISNAKMADEVLNNLMIENFRKGASEVCSNYVRENTGATSKIISFFKERLN
ncbi:MAG TPA: glycosyltransferase N-terminal domain-containing protein [Roseivirga sp.]